MASSGIGAVCAGLDTSDQPSASVFASQRRTIAFSAAMPVSMSAAWIGCTGLMTRRMRSARPTISLTVAMLTPPEKERADANAGPRVPRVAGLLALRDLLGRGLRRRGLARARAVVDDGRRHDLHAQVRFDRKLRLDARRLGLGVTLRGAFGVGLCVRRMQLGDELGLRRHAVDRLGV